MFLSASMFSPHGISDESVANVAELLEINYDSPVTAKCISARVPWQIPTLRDRDAFYTIQRFRVSLVLRERSRESVELTPFTFHDCQTRGSERNQSSAQESSSGRPEERSLFLFLYPQNPNAVITRNMSPTAARAYSDQARHLRDRTAVSSTAVRRRSRARSTCTRWWGRRGSP